MSTNNNKNICVLVLGDIGRSPRMQYHVKSLVENNFNVDVIGYVETKPNKFLTNNSSVKIYPLSPLPQLVLPNTLRYIFKTIWQILSLLMVLITIRRPSILLCQNPPAIPTLFIAYFYCLIVRCKFIIDWHNYAYTILALNTKSNSLILRISKWIEFFYGKLSHENFCVTKAMKDDLRNNWNINATILYDRPPLEYQPITLKKKHDLFVDLSSRFQIFSTTSKIKNEEICEETVFTEKLVNGDIRFKKNRPALIISSTSWTPDEDFGILLKALEDYEETAQESNHYPKLICVITGKGPLKEFYNTLISTKEWKNVSVITPWLENEEYPQLLAAADLGICLHWSSSGLDLPMKVVDMFGCGLPVCAINFKCLNELVQHGKNGFIFDDSKELASHITNWFYDFPSNIALTNMKLEFKKNIEQFQSLRWSENWNINVLPKLN